MLVLPCLQNLRLLRQASHVRNAQLGRRHTITISARTSTYQAFSRARMHGLETDVAFLPLRVLGARLGKVDAAGGFRAYEKAHRKLLTTTFATKLPRLPIEVVSHFVSFAFHTGYY